MAYYFFKMEASRRTPQLEVHLVFLTFVYSEKIHSDIVKMQDVRVCECLCVRILGY